MQSMFNYSTLFLVVVFVGLGYTRRIGEDERTGGDRARIPGFPGILRESSELLAPMKKSGDNIKVTAIRNRRSDPFQPLGGWKIEGEYGGLVGGDSYNPNFSKVDEDSKVSELYVDEDYTEVKVGELGEKPKDASDSDVYVDLK